MSYSIETLNRGRKDEFGFWGPDTTRVRLGELPPMSFSQFCDYASNTLIVSLEGATQTERENIAKIVDQAVLQIKDLKVQPKKTAADFPRLHHAETEELLAFSLSDVNLTVHKALLPTDFLEAIDDAQKAGDRDRLNDLTDELIIAINIANGQEAVDYGENPFKIMNSQISIGGKYEVDFEEFAYFVTYVLTGGLAGWGSRGIPQETHANLEKLVESVRIVTQA